MHGVPRHNDPTTLNNYAYYLSLRNDRLEKAAQMSLRSNELAPGQPSFQDTYAWVLYQQGKYAEAQQSSDAAKKWALWSTIIGLVVLVIYGILYATGSIVIDTGTTS